MKILLMLLYVTQMSFAAYKMESQKEGLDIVWGMDFLDNEKLIFTEKSGKIKILNLKTKKVQEVAGAPKVYTRGQAGLLDIKLDPEFSKNKKIYLTYSKVLEDRKTTALGVGILESNKLTNFKDLLVGEGNSNERIHFGSRIAFGMDGKIYFTIGERGQRENAQNLSNHFGKVLRINKDGSVPSDNPFVGKKDAKPEIWSYGHRNPQGLVFDTTNNKLYEMEHGPRGGDEINIIKKGLNYGWPKQSYGREYVLPMDVGEKKVDGVEQPFKFYDPSIAPCGLVLYRGKRYPELNNSLIAGALKLTHINVLNLETKKETRIFDDKDLRIRSIAISGDDFIYFSTDNGQIFKLLP